ncbi:hypothetical protein [Deinococcus radiotolerans]|nr:hypothetical protein [Deinococcus radiotolerans]
MAQLIPEELLPDLHGLKVGRGRGEQARHLVRERGGLAGLLPS